VKDILIKVCFAKNWSLDKHIVVSLKGKKLAFSLLLETLEENQFYVVEKSTI
jgi:hypothetical protein